MVSNTISLYRTVTGWPVPATSAARRADRCASSVSGCTSRPLELPPPSAGARYSRRSKQKRLPRCSVTKFFSHFIETARCTGDGLAAMDAGTAVLGPSSAPAPPESVFSPLDGTPSAGVCGSWAGTEVCGSCSGWRDSGRPRSDGTPSSAGAWGSQFILRFGSCPRFLLWAGLAVAAAAGGQWHTVCFWRRGDRGGGGAGRCVCVGCTSIRRGGDRAHARRAASAPAVIALPRSLYLATKKYM